MELAKHRRARNRKHVQEGLPKGVMDVIETDYKDRYDVLQEDLTRIETLFSREDWIDILMKSRLSHEQDIKWLKKHGKL